MEKPAEAIIPIPETYSEKPYTNEGIYLLPILPSDWCIHFYTFETKAERVPGDRTAACRTRNHNNTFDEHGQEEESASREGTLQLQNILHQEPSTKPKLERVDASALVLARLAASYQLWLRRRFLMQYVLQRKCSLFAGASLLLSVLFERVVVVRRRQHSQVLRPTCSGAVTRHTFCFGFEGIEMNAPI